MSDREPIPARYHAQIDPAFQGNPWAEALPPVLKPREIVEYLRRPPSATPSDALRAEDDLYRIQQAHNLWWYHEPMSKSVRIFQRLTQLLWQGYRPRNPLAHRYPNQLPDGTWVRPVPRGGRPLGLHIVGHSGMGKSTAVQESLSYYPQVITHSQFREQVFITAQITWLCLECPRTDALRSMCTAIIDRVDELLGNDGGYRDLYIRSRSTEQDLEEAVKRIFKNHGLGLLVLDEVQQLADARGDSGRRILNFFVSFTNELNVPLVLVGTDAAIDHLGRDFRQLRRGGSFGAIHWPPMKSPDGGLDDEFKTFCEGLWKYQYVTRPQPLHPRHLEALRYHSEGITALIVTLFILAQERAIETGLETISPEVIESVGEGEEFHLLLPGLEALANQSGEPSMLFSDLSDHLSPLHLHRLRESRMNRGRGRLSSGPDGPEEETCERSPTPEAPTEQEQQEDDR